VFFLCNNFKKSLILFYKNVNWEKFIGKYCIIMLYFSLSFLWVIIKPTQDDQFDKF